MHLTAIPLRSSGQPRLISDLRRQTLRLCLWRVAADRLETTLVFQSGQLQRIAIVAFLRLEGPGVEDVASLGHQGTIPLVLGLYVRKECREAFSQMVRLGNA